MVTPGQLSEAVTVKLIDPVPEGGQEPVVAVMFPGQLITGDCVSLIVTVNPHEVMLLEASFAVHVTGVVATGKNEPEAGVQMKVAPGQLSLTIGA